MHGGTAEEQCVGRDIGETLCSSGMSIINRMGKARMTEPVIDKQDSEIMKLLLVPSCAWSSEKSTTLTYTTLTLYYIILYYTRCPDWPCLAHDQQCLGPNLFFMN